MACTARRLFCPAWSVILLALAVALQVRAQESPLDSAAAQMADVISHSNQKSVVVFDFVGPDRKITALGKKLADEFSNALTKSRGDFQVKDRSQIRQDLREDAFAPTIVRDPTYAEWLAWNLKARVFILGALTIEKGRLGIVVDSYTVNGLEKIASRRIELPLTSEVKAMSDDNAEESVLAAYPKWESGYSSPVCAYCPPGQYSAEALKEQIQGKVLLLVVVGEDGQIADMRVMNGLPYGLTAQAIQAVRTWRLKPATAPDGKPIAVVSMIGVNFSLY